MLTRDTMYAVRDIYEKINHDLDDVLVGQKNVKKAITSALLCDKNSKVLLTGNTGTGKTTMSNYLRTSFNNLRFSITSDMLPSDVQDVLIRQPNFQFLYIDEFNRASGKLQSAFLELFEERQISYAGAVYGFSDFFVFATQNSADIAGVFNVPQAVYDRIDLNIYFDNLTPEEKKAILFRSFIPAKQSHISLSDIDYTTGAVANFNLTKEDEDLLMHIFSTIDSLSYNGQPLFAGSNIRAHAFAIKLAKITALSEGRNYIIPSDLSDYILYLYLHRINQNVARLDNNDVQNIIHNASKEILGLRRAKGLRRA